MPQHLQELKIRICDVCELVDMQVLSSVWNETDYRLDVCRITSWAHIHIIYVTFRTLRLHCAETVFLE